MHILLSLDKHYPCLACNKRRPKKKTMHAPYDMILQKINKTKSKWQTSWPGLCKRGSKFPQLNCRGLELWHVGCHWRRNWKCPSLSIFTVMLLVMFLPKKININVKVKWSVIVKDKKSVQVLDDFGVILELNWRFLHILHAHSSSSEN